MASLGVDTIVLCWKVSSPADFLRSDEFRGDSDVSITPNGCYDDKEVRDMALYCLVLLNKEQRLIPGALGLQLHRQSVCLAFTRTRVLSLDPHTLAVTDHTGAWEEGSEVQGHHWPPSVCKVGCGYLECPLKTINNSKLLEDLKTRNEWGLWER